MKPMKLVVFSSDLGWMAAAAQGDVLCQLTFGHPSPDKAVQAMHCVDSHVTDPAGFLSKLSRRLQNFCREPTDDFHDVELDLERFTDFQRAVVQGCRNILAGTTLTYGELAQTSGRPGAARAVGRVMATNRFPIVVPCHRVVGANGSLGGFSAPDGLNMKRRLLALEAECSPCTA